MYFKGSYSRIGLLALSIVAFMLAAPKARATDVIVNGTTTTISGGTYGIIYVANNGTLTMNGAVKANVIGLEGGTIIINGPTTAGTITISSGTASLRGNIAVSSISVSNSTLTVTGNSNTVGTVTVGASGTLSALGNWYAGSLLVASNGVLSVVAYDGSTAGAGSLWFDATTIQVNYGGSISGDYGGSISGDYAGNDSRGRANSFANAGGAGGANNGGHGWWDASTQGSGYGDYYTYICDMGSAGGNMGGGAIALVADTITVNGSVHANGYNGWYIQFQYAPGAGSGGTILIDAETLIVNGPLSANGGTGDSYAGSGSGGRIKVFYLSGGGTNLAPLCSAAAGPHYTGKTPPGPGTIYFDARPLAPTLIAPLSGDTVSGSGTTFQLTVHDGSTITDGRDDLLFSAIELSTNGFATVSYRFDQSQSLSGWSAFSNRNGDTVSFVSPTVIPVGTYQWRALTQDRSVYGAYSAERIVNIGSPTYITGPTLHIERTVKLSFQTGHYDYRLQISQNLQTWTDTTTIVHGDGSVVELYLPAEQLASYYRLLVL